MNWLSTIMILLAAYLAVFVEYSFDLPRRLLGSQVHLLPVLMVYAALTSNLGTVLALAFLGGIAFDSLSDNPIGVSTLPLLAVGVGIFKQKSLILRNEIFAQCVLGFMACAITPGVTLLALLALGKTPLLGLATLWQWTVMAVGGAALTPLVFKALDGIRQAMTYPLLKPPVFRSDREIKRGRL